MMAGAGLAVMLLTATLNGNKSIVLVANRFDKAHNLTLTTISNERRIQLL